MTERWTLNRAGITNVYQYADETLQFGGGRLLLRGVNGSGKSTAMNMLLPFLLDADTRRIDAAGEQSSVLRSWMLSGRTEPQPVGYLWLEFRCGDQYLVCGCGIKANRATDRVTTWWFVTDRRPGIDVALVEGRVPLSVDALKEKIGAHAVFAHDQRPAYRSAIRSKLFGGADLDQHIRLLHVVRNPRVGDRIDVDLPQYLEGALPQLSDEALDDAAQPLEDLEEHRRNVEALRRTAETLDALSGVYQSYARLELRTRAEEQLANVDAVNERRRVESRARREAEAARAVLDQAVVDVNLLEATEVRLREEIGALKDSDAYKSGKELDDLRRLVADRQSAVIETKRRLDSLVARRVDAAGELRGAQATFDVDLDGATSELGDLDQSITAAALSIGGPDAPTVAIIQLGDDLESPAGVLDVAGEMAAIGDVRAAAQIRRGDVDDVRQSLDTVDFHEGQLRQAEAERDRAITAVERAETSFASAVEALAGAVNAWRQALRHWMEQLAVARLAAGLATDVGTADVDIPDLADRRQQVLDRLTSSSATLADLHRADDASLGAERERQQSAIAQLADRLAELERRTYAAPPASPWQRPDRQPVFSELVDFAPHLDDRERTGLESALEAAGILGAELTAAGALRLAGGELVLTPGAVADAPLSDLLMITVSDELSDQVDTDALSAVLQSISTAATSAAATVVTTTGWFRIGALSGQHSKATAEHIGVTARRQAIERQRAQIVAELAEARRALALTENEILVVRERLRHVVALQRELPQPLAVTESMQGIRFAEDKLTEAREVVEVAAELVATRESLHAEAVGESRRRAATLLLPIDRPGLRSVERALEEIARHCDGAAQRLRTLSRSCDAWIKSVTRWSRAVDDERGALDQHGQATARHASTAMRLATLEDSIGTDYEEVLASLVVSEADLLTTGTALADARDSRERSAIEAERHRGQAATAAEQLRIVEQRCVAALPAIRRVLEVQGLVAAATRLIESNDVTTAPLEPGGDSARSAPEGVDAGGAGEATATAIGEPTDTAVTFPAVPQSPDGVRELALSVLARIPAPERAGVTADSVRQSLRLRRANLGAGWDAEDHQPDPSMPLSVDVTGPEVGRTSLPEAQRRVAVQLRQRASLLTAQQDQALRNLLQGLIAREVADKMHAATELVALMNKRLDAISTAHGIGASLRWKRRDDIDAALATTIDLLSKPPDLRTADQDRSLALAMSERIDEARRANPESPYRELIADVLDYKQWHRMTIVVRRHGQPDVVLRRDTPLSEGEKKMVSYLPLFAAVAASCDALAAGAPAAPRFVLLDDAFAKVSEDNHGQLFGLLVELDLDFIATSERLWGTHATVPELAITEVLRDAELGVIVLEHSRWNGRERVGAG